MRFCHTDRRWLPGCPYGRRPAVSYAVRRHGGGAGQLASALVDAGACVTGIDVSPAMIEIAKARLGESATFVVGDLSQPLTFESDSFDVVVASLVMHYVEDWTPVLEEIRRVLTPNGSLSFSTHHPTMDWKLHSPDNYFTKKRTTETWVKGGRPFEVSFWRRSLAAISKHVHDAGFVIDLLDEPMPIAALAEIDADVDNVLRTRPRFLFIRAIPKG